MECKSHSSQNAEDVADNLLPLDVGINLPVTSGIIQIPQVVLNACPDLAGCWPVSPYHSCLVSPWAQGKTCKWAIMGGADRGLV